MKSFKLVYSVKTHPKVGTVGRTDVGWDKSKHHDECKYAGYIISHRGGKGRGGGFYECVVCYTDMDGNRHEDLLNKNFRDRAKAGVAIGIYYLKNSGANKREEFLFDTIRLPKRILEGLKVVKANINGIITKIGIVSIPHTSDYSSNGITAGTFKLTITGEPFVEYSKTTYENIYDACNKVLTSFNLDSDNRFDYDFISEVAVSTAHIFAKEIDKPNAELIGSTGSFNQIDEDIKKLKVRHRSEKLDFLNKQDQEIETLKNKHKSEKLVFVKKQRQEIKFLTLKRLKIYQNEYYENVTLNKRHREKITDARKT